MGLRFAPVGHLRMVKYKLELVMFIRIVTSDCAFTNPVLRDSEAC